MRETSYEEAMTLNAHHQQGDDEDGVCRATIVNAHHDSSKISQSLPWRHANRETRQVRLKLQKIYVHYVCLYVVGSGACHHTRFSQTPARRPFFSLGYIHALETTE